MRAQDHLVRLSEDWALWKWFVLRGTGFSMDQVLRLGSPEAARAADTLLEAERSTELACAQAIGALQQRSEPATRALVRKAVRRLRAGTLPEDEGLRAPELDALRAAQEASARALADAEGAHAKASLDASAFLRETASDPRFREAVLWQNRGALKTGLDSLLRQAPGATDVRTRQKELLVATYLQRYCTKNDQIGFFGPVGWGTYTMEDRAVVMKPGPSLLLRRMVFLEHWCVDALARKLAENPELLRELAPRRSATVGLDGTTLRVGDDERAITPLLARVLAACDGMTSARAIARAIVEERALALLSADEVYALLSTLAAQGTIVWTLEVPTSDPHPERSLAARLQRLPASPHRAQALAALDELCSARDAVAHAAGDVEALDRAVSSFDAVFTRLTGATATRGAGAVYAARTPFYEDCVRDLELRIGAPTLARLAPLRLVLHLARWAACTMATRYLALFESTFRQLRDALGTSRVSYARFLSELAPHLPAKDRDATPIVAAVMQELHARWSALIGLDGSRSRIEVKADDLEPAISAWEAPRLRWPSAAFHSPDLIVAARDLEAFERGEFSCVLGELHVTINTVIGNGLFFPDPATMAARFSADVGPTYIEEVLPPALTTRVNCHRLPIPGSLSVEVDATCSRLPRDRVLSVGEMEVLEEDGRIVVRARSEGAPPRSLDLLSTFAWKLTWSALSSFTLHAEEGHVPRITIDDLVVQRESWVFLPSELGFAAEESAFARFRGARRWVRAAGLPRWVFVKIPEELKPYYIDLESTVSIELLVKLVHKASRVKISEMLPTPEQAWLSDAEGKRYACELRTAALDLRPRDEGGSTAPGPS